MDEDITSVYAQFAWNGEIGGRKSNLTAGVRYEETEVVSDTLQAVPTAVVWTADNDFAQQFPSGGAQVVSGESDSSSDLDDGLGDGNIRIRLVRGCRVPSHVFGIDL